MRQSRRSVIGSGLMKAVNAAAKKEESLRSKMFGRDLNWRRRLSNLRVKLSDLRYEFAELRKENKRLRRAVHYLENVNGGITERQTKRLEKVLGIPAHIERAANWHRVAGGYWDK